MFTVTSMRERLSRLYSSVKKRAVQWKVWQYRDFVVAGLSAAAGISAILAGLILLVLMALSGSILGVIITSFSIGCGVVLLIGVYLWLTIV
jgi:hypothetical protein